MEIHLTTLTIPTIKAKFNQRTDSVTQGQGMTVIEVGSDENMRCCECPLSGYCCEKCAVATQILFGPSLQKLEMIVWMLDDDFDVMVKFVFVDVTKALQ